MEVEFLTPITEIPSGLCRGLKHLERITLAPETEIKYIISGAFQGCSSLKDIECLGNKIQVIESDTFKGAGISGELILPETLTEIGDNAFADYGPFSRVHLTENLKKYDMYHWFKGTKINGINIPDSVIKNPEFLDSMSDFGYNEVTFNGNMTLDVYSLVIKKNGLAAQMDTEAIILSDRTYIPARFIAEAPGYEVRFNN